ncbi:MAG: IS110 family transposase [Deltaproteobacteria bacterium]|nr:MAG: IS110 family transposase [Deltaproteobacteria bacterium]RPJ17870.1 MAG: IS110 family transposase [Deltaproteobacteria bacterium]
MKKRITFVGLDTHKNSIEVALADDGRNTEVRLYGSIGGDLASLDKMIRKLQATGTELRFVYEAGPCGYQIYRHLRAQGLQCDVVAPSMVPKRSGDRIKTDRRDACNLARLYRAGELTAIYVPQEDDEAMRDLVRGRQDAVNAQRKVRQQLGGFLLRHGFRYPGKCAWTLAHRRWLAGVRMAHPAQQIMMQEYIHSVEECTQRVHRLTEQILQLMPDWRMRPLVGALQALRGVAPVVAATAVAEIGPMGRFERPRQLMAYLGLVPSESSSGGSVRRGAITKTGNGHARRALIEAAQAYSHPARISRVMLKRQEAVPETIRQIAWKAQLRLCARFRKLTARGKSRNRVVTAIARELSGFMWAIAKQVPVP